MLGHGLILSGFVFVYYCFIVAEKLMLVNTFYKNANNCFKTVMEQRLEQRPGHLRNHLVEALLLA